MQRDVEPGEPVVFHVHNHGANTYRLVDITIEPGDLDP